MKFYFITILLLIIELGFISGQNSYSNCIPCNRSDSVIFFTATDNAKKEFEYLNYRYSLSYLKNAEKILPECSEIQWNIALCHWYLLDVETANIPMHLINAKKHFDNYLKYSGENESENSDFARDCLKKIESDLNIIMVNKYFDDGLYYGQTLDSIQNGYGIFTWNNGDRYEGEWENGKRNGNGIFCKNNGTRYEGNWKKDKRHDLKGKEYNSNNILVREGAYIEDVFNAGFDHDYKIHDLRCWQNIEKSSDVNQYLKYLNDYRNFGIFKESAIKKINNIVENKWEEIKDSLNENVFNDYIKEYSVIPWIDFTNVKNTIIFKKQYAEEEKKNWDNIKTSSEEKDFEDYLSFYTKGDYIAEAQDMLKKIRIYNLSDSLQWDSIKSRNIIEPFYKYINTYSEHGKYLVKAREKIDKIIKQYDRIFYEAIYSKSGSAGFKLGIMNNNHWGGYFKYQDNYLINSINNIQEFRFGKFLSGGALYAITNWLYSYAGLGLNINGDNNSTANVLYSGVAEYGLQLNVAGVSLSGGIKHSGLGSGSIHQDYDLGIGINLYRDKSKMETGGYLSYVYSKSAQFGLMYTNFRNTIDSYYKIQLPVNALADVYGLNLGNSRHRYSITGGVDFSISNWLGVYSGLGAGLYKNDPGDSENKIGMETEYGVILRIPNAVSVSFGKHNSNVLSQRKYSEFDFGLGFDIININDNHKDQTILEFSTSSTAQLGIMNGFTYGGIGGYGRLQITNSSKNNLNGLFDGSRRSFTVGPMIALTNWLSLYGGIGGGLYTKNDINHTRDMAFEAETGLNLKISFLNLSAGPHWCRIGKDDKFLDYNLGIGFSSNSYLINYDLGIDYSEYFKYIYNRNAPIGFEIGTIGDYAGFYMKYQMFVPTKQEVRLNFSTGAIIAISGLAHVNFGVGMGYYDTSMGFDLEASVTLNIFHIPVSIGIKSCRVGSRNNFIDYEYGVGLYGSEH